MLVGLVGKPNVGKSTFFSAATKAPAEIANYPFTTIKPNRGVAYLRHAPCPHTVLGKACTPRTGACTNGVRWVPAELLDVAGLVPGAHEGKGLGNQFLDDLRTADALVHVVDASGATAIDGNPVPKGTHDPLEDVQFLDDEISWWIEGIIAKGWERESKALMQAGTKLEVALGKKLTGLGITEPQIVTALHKSGIGANPIKWTPEDMLGLARALRDVSKPIVLAANKADQAPPELLEKLKKIPNAKVVPTCAASEIALRKAADHGLIRYEPGAKSFEIVDASKLTAQQKAGLKLVQETVFDRFGGTGVQDVLEHAVYNVLDRIVAFPVEDETHYTDKEGRILPDAHLLKRGATAKDLAYKVHTDLGDHFIRAIDAKKHRPVAGDHALENGDVIRIVAGK